MRTDHPEGEQNFEHVWLGIVEAIDLVSPGAAVLPEGGTEAGSGGWNELGGRYYLFRQKRMSLGWRKCRLWFRFFSLGVINWQN